jgi:hypothetical protein
MKFHRFVIATAILSCAVGSAQALSVSYATAANTIPASATASFSSSAGGLALTLTNTFASSIGSVGQVLTGISFDVAGLSSSGTASYVSGTLIEVANGGGVSAASESELAWNVDHPASSTLYLSVFGGGQPDYGLLNQQLDYASANGSIAGNSPHNPFYQGTVSFALASLAGVSADSGISNVQFHFGTAQDSGFVSGDCTAGCSIPSPVPEPETYALMLAGLGLVGWMSRHRRKR